MAATVLAFPRAVPALPGKPADPFQTLPEFAREEAGRRLAIIKPGLDRVASGVSVRAVSAVIAAHAALQATAGEEPVSAKTIARWISDYRTGGLMKLAPQYKGRQRATYGWEERALHMFNRPQRPGYSTVAIWLRQEGHANASDHLVRAFLKGAPSNLTETGKKRLGEHYYAQNVRPHIVRDASALPIGFVYQGDGHCCDVYVAAPATGNPFRPELTVWLDVRSRYCTGWWLSESESAITTLYSFSHALLAQDHAPAMVHTDPGSGFTARVISDAETGFFARFAIEMITALPGNARGKGLVEGWFRWFEERCGKSFATFCGHCRTDDDLRALTQKVKRGAIKLPSLIEYREAIRVYVSFYNNNPQEELGGESPAQVWARVERVPLETPAAAVMRPRKTRTVRRWGVELDGRTYRSDALASHESREVVVEYDLHDDTCVVILDAKGRFVCEAMLTQKHDWLPQSRIEEAQAKRLKGQQQRLQVKLDEAESRSRTPLSAVAAIAALEGNAPAPMVSTADEVFAVGHSIGTPPPVVFSHTTRAPDEAEMVRVREVIEEQSAAASNEERPEARFYRALQLRDRRAQGQRIDETESRWLDNYAQSAECQGLADVYESFGYLPGIPESTLQNDEDPARTGPSDTAA